MINLAITQMKIKLNNKNWPYIPDKPYKILITGSSVPGKTNVLLTLIQKNPDIDETYLYAKEPQ